MLTLMSVATLFLACNPKENEAGTPQESVRTYADYIDSKKSIAVQAGDVYGDVAIDLFKAKEAPEYASVADMLESLRMGKVDAALLSDSYVKQLIDSGMYPDFEYLWVPKEVYVNEAGPIFHTEELRDQYNEWFRGIAADGTWEETVNRWIGVPLPEQEDIPKYELTGENGTLKMCDTGNYPPLIYFDANAEPAGFDVDIMSQFAQSMGMKLEITMMAYEAIGPYVISGKADMSSCTLTITDERNDGLLFGDPSVITQAVLIVAAKQNGGYSDQKDGGFIEWIDNGVKRNLITDNRWKMILNGLGVTVIISFASQFLGTVFGCFVCFLLTHRHKFARWIANLYCGFIHGTPIVVLLMITYYIIFGNTGISSVLVAIAAFTMVQGAIIAQNLKDAIETVDPVEIEAARSMGFSAIQAFVTVTLPQAVRRALPAYTDGFVELVKSTAIVGYIAIQDLTRAGDIIRSRTYDAYFPLLLVALIYLAVTTVCVIVFRLVVKKINKGELPS